MHINLALVAFIAWALVMWFNGYTIEGTILFGIGLGLKALEDTAIYITEEYIGRRRD